MNIPIKRILLEATHRIQTNDPNNFSPEDIIKHTNNLYSQLNILSKKYNIPKDKLLIFGSAALGLKGLRKPNDLDIGIHPDYLNNIKQYNKPTRGSYGAQYDIGNLSFIHQQALPKLNGQNLFDLENLNKVKGYNTINFDHWKEMQRKDPLQKDKRFLIESSLPQPKTIHVNNIMQKNYSYELTEPQGKNFDPRFKPELTPKQMLELGIFGGKYFNDVAKTDEYPKDWWTKAKLSGTIGPGTKPDYKLNYYGVKASLPLKQWIQKGWITPEDPRGWVEWYFRYYQGRRIPKVDDLQIKRWLHAKRHTIRLGTHSTKTGNDSLAIRQGILHWAYDPRNIGK